MDNSKTGAPQRNEASTNPPSIEDLLSQGNWEERVAAARKKRDALKSGQPKAPAKRAPTFPEFAPADALPSPDTAEEADGFVFREGSTAEPIDLMAKLAARKPAVSRPAASDPPPPTQSTPPRPAPTLITPVSQVAPTPQPEAQEDQDKSKVALVAFACFFGIGIGIAVGAGLVWSLGGFGGKAPAAGSQVAALEPAPKPLQVTFPLAPHQSRTGTLSGLTLPPVSETALTQALPTRPMLSQTAAASTSAPPALASPVPSQAPESIVIAAAPAVRPFTLGPVPALNKPIATPNLLSGIPRFTVPDGPAGPVAAIAPLEVQTYIADLAKAPQSPTGKASFPVDTTPLIETPVLFDLQRPASPSMAGLSDPLVAPEPVRAELSGIAPVTAPSGEMLAFAVPAPVATPQTGTIPVAMQLPLRNEALAMPVPQPAPSQVEALVTMDAALLAPETGTAGSPVRNGSAQQPVAPVDVAMLRPAPQTDLAPQRLQSASPPPASWSPDTVALGAPTVAQLSTSLPAQTALPASPLATALPTPVRFDGGAPLSPVTAPTPAIAPFDDLPTQLEAPATAAIVASHPVEITDAPGSIAALNGPIVARFENLAPEIITAPWRGRTLSAKLGLSPEQVARLELVLNAPDSVEEEQMAARAASLYETGFALQKQNRVSFKITRPHIRYYNDSDARVAQALAEEFDVELRDFSRNGADNGPNRIEFWMAGETDSKPATTRTVANKKKAAPPRRKTIRRVDPTQALRQRLARKLRQGDHL